MDLEIQKHFYDVGQINGTFIQTKLYIFFDNLSLISVFLKPIALFSLPYSQAPSRGHTGDSSTALCSGVVTLVKAAPPVGDG